MGNMILSKTRLSKTCLPKYGLRFNQITKPKQ